MEWGHRTMGTWSGPYVISEPAWWIHTLISIPLSRDPKRSANMRHSKCNIGERGVGSADLWSGLKYPRSIQSCRPGQCDAWSYGRSWKIRFLPPHFEATAPFSGKFVSQPSQVGFIPSVTLKFHLQPWWTGLEKFVFSKSKWIQWMIKGSWVRLIGVWRKD